MALFSSDSSSSKLRSKEAVRDAFLVATSRKEIAILVTPYLRFESFFVRAGEEEFQLAATMSKDAAMAALRSSELRIRFPTGLGFYEGSIKFLGFAIADGRPTLRFSLPEQLNSDDQRAAYRVDRVGRVLVTFSTSKFDILMGTLANISVSGAKVHSLSALEAMDIKTGHLISVSIPLLPDLNITSQAIVRHIKGNDFGLEFKPTLPDRVLEPLSRWVFKKREEDRERISRRSETAAPVIEVKPDPSAMKGIALLTFDAEVENSLKEAFKEVYPLIKYSPTLQGLKEALAAIPVLVIFHLVSLSLDDRRRIKTLAEALGGKVPLLLIGSRMETQPLMELANELKAATALVYNPQRATFLQRLALGIIRRSQGAGEEVPMAPSS